MALAEWLDCEYFLLYLIDSFLSLLYNDTMLIHATIKHFQNRCALLWNSTWSRVTFRYALKMSICTSIFSYDLWLHHIETDEYLCRAVEKMRTPYFKYMVMRIEQHPEYIRFYTKMNQYGVNFTAFTEYLKKFLWESDYCLWRIKAVN